jgi:hypothetical protein
MPKSSEAFFALKKRLEGFFAAFLGSFIGLPGLGLAGLSGPCCIFYGGVV